MIQAKKLCSAMLAMLCSVSSMAATNDTTKQRSNWIMEHDSVMMATRNTQDDTTRVVPTSLSLSVQEAQDYAVKQNRSLRNSSLAVQQAYAARWQTIAAMLPQVDASYSYSNYLGYSATMSTAMGDFNIDMPNQGALGITASVGINGQAIVGVLLQNLAIDMQRLSLEQSEDNLRASVKTSYISILVLQDVVKLLDSSLQNVNDIIEMTQRTVQFGVNEQTTADQIAIRANSLKNNIQSQKRSIQLATNSLKVLLDVPAETELTLTSSLDELLSGEEVMALLGEEFIKEHNLSYRQLEKNFEIAKMNVHMAGWAYGPTVGLAYNYTNQQYYGEGGMRMTPPNVVQVSIKLPLWSSGKRAAGVVEKKIALEQARNTLAETADQLNIQYQQLRFNLQNAYETYLTEQENIDVATRVFQSVSNKYRFGTNSNLELINASNDVISAQSSYVQAVLTLINAEVELDKFLK
ncbi:MAG: TolC family protein [Paludibacteraceae bacterium]|nr:TolC family protein [Paludibacteraceae bacterium]